ncbi:50S ribosomal protein L3 [Candidatus Micrarchaeota archaeon]|nr:50S ribosomal protein L3 [Candidatus Micrarchaeota archaeon]MBD3418267.1 50S ribosomal protein L3 [Candidatus Micrarchaeota archaeon]
MTDIWKPRKGSLAFRPRGRARRQVPRVSHWAETSDARLLGFAGYKAGMTHLTFVDDSEGPTNGQEISSAVTVIEVPPLYAYGVRGYKGGKAVGDMLVEDAAVLKKLGIKKKKTKVVLGEENTEEVSVLVYTQPGKTGVGKKHPERMEIPVGGSELKEKLDYAKSLLGKELRPEDLFKSGEYMDVISVSTGKGWEGTRKRFGTALHRPKATGQRRASGTLGQWHPAYILYTARRAGQLGYHSRTEVNKRIMRIGGEVDEINPKGGFPHYGFVKNSYILLKGSVPGPVKRLVRMRLGTRAPSKVQEPKLTYVSVESKV